MMSAYAALIMRSSFETNENYVPITDPQFYYPYDIGTYPFYKWRQHLKHYVLMIMPVNLIARVGDIRTTLKKKLCALNLCRLFCPLRIRSSK